MTPYLSTDRATLYHARAEEVYPHLAQRSVSMVWSDGPYALKKAAWDMMGVDGLADWYAPHVEAWGRVCAPSATVYLWNTAEGWARIDPVMRAAGWTFRVLVTWLKTGAHPALIGAANASMWPDVTEAAGMYTRGKPLFVNTGSVPNVWPLSPTADMRDERIYSEEMTVHRVHGTPQRAGAHPCQKPLAFADRAIRASTRIGETILDPFSGTNRCAVACQRLPAEEARHAIGIEMEERWLEAVRPSLIADYAHRSHAKQSNLFTRPP